MTGFGLKRLRSTITDSRKKGYTKNVHYVYFLIPNIGTSGATGATQKVKKLFLTYAGLMRVFYASRTGTVAKFVDWANKVLFTAHLGTAKQKTELASKLLGESTKTIKSVFNKTTRQMPCVYLFLIGKVSTLREILDICDDYDDEDLVFKWGMTNDLRRRTGEHEKTYSKKYGYNLELVLFNPIDPQFISKAETELKHIIIDMEFKFENDEHTELAIIPENKMKLIKKQYNLLSIQYAGHYTELQHKIQLMEKNHELEIMKLKNENELLKKDIQILKLSKPKRTT